MVGLARRALPVSGPVIDILAGKMPGMTLWVLGVHVPGPGRIWGDLQFARELIFEKIGVQAIQLQPAGDRPLGPWVSLDDCGWRDRRPLDDPLAFDGQNLRMPAAPVVHVRCSMALGIDSPPPDGQLLAGCLGVAIHKQYLVQPLERVHKSLSNPPALQGLAATDRPDLVPEPVVLGVDPGNQHVCLIRDQPGGAVVAQGEDGVLLPGASMRPRL